MPASRKRDYLTPLVALLRAVCPHLSERRLKTIVKKAMPDPHFHGTMLRYLERIPNALITGPSDAPLSIARLAQLLIESGESHIRLPKCQLCEWRGELPYKYDAGRICNGCYAKRVHLEQCSRCQTIAPIMTRDKGNPVCPTCWGSDPARREVCCSCRSLAFVSARTDGGPLCQLCYDPPKRKCSECGELCAIHSTKTGADVCKECYMTRRNVHAAKRSSRPYHRGKQVRRRPTRRRTCYVCGESRLCLDYTTRKPICVQCAGRPKITCTGCRQSRAPQAIWAENPVCSVCYDDYRTNPRRCVKCGQVALAVPTNHGDICRACLHLPDLPKCVVCGVETRLYEAQTCPHCVLKKRAFELLADGKDEISPDLRPVYNALTERIRSSKSITWLQGEGAAATLRAIARGEMRLSHAALDGLAKPRIAHFLRTLLMSAGVLPHVSVAAKRVELWLNGFLAKLPAADRRIVATYADWRLLRRQRRRIDNDVLTSAGIKWLQMRLRIAAAFLAWLRSEHRSLETCDQGVVDRWLTKSDATSSYAIRDFIRWASRRHIPMDLDVPRRSARVEHASADEEEQWNSVRRLLHDESIALDLRLIGLMNQVFAQQVSRMCSLADSCLIAKRNDTYIDLGSEPLRLPPGIAELFARQAEQCRSDPKALTRDGRRWLFPGQNYGRHVSEDTIYRRLTDLGIRARPARNAALIHLAADTPAPILSRLLNINAQVAAKWSELAGNAYHNYVRSRKTSSDKMNAGAKQKQLKRRRSVPNLKGHTG